jgi:uncharacterized repeat protein (TIGR03806 family)
VFAACGVQSLDEADYLAQAPQRLSSYGLFRGDGSSQEPRAGVIPYEINTPLFSDYSEKHRFVKLPAGGAARYDPTRTFEFPEETIIAKTFAYPRDARYPSRGRRLIETRILRKTRAGWVGLPYRWNEAQSEAILEIAGGAADVSWIDAQGRPRANRYMIPNVNQCKECHRAEGKSMVTLGIKAGQLHRDFEYAHGSENQLAYWTRIGALRGTPALEGIPRFPVWADPKTGDLESRARAWIDVNCAHCHNSKGTARSSGLDLSFDQREPSRFGVFKRPVAAGRGSGNRLYNIVPGKPEESILLYRISSTDPGVAMPELGKRLIHEEGVALVRDWISEMKER